MEASIPYARSELVDLFHRLGRVEETRYDEQSSILIGVLPERALNSFSPFVAIRGRGERIATLERRSPETAA